MTKKMITFSLMFCLVSLSSACSGGIEKTVEVSLPSSPTAESFPPTASPAIEPPTPEPSEEPRPYAPAQGGGTLVSAKNDFFAASGNCAVCHRGQIDQAGADVSIDAFWRSSMMANSAIDPYYLAGVSMNLAAFPDYDAAIQSKCSTCHMPMAHTSDIFSGGDSLIFGSEGFLDPDHPWHDLARDGNSCSACHQIQDQDLGQFSSFSGGFQIDSATPMGEREVFGRFDPLPAGERMMTMSSGFIARQSDHILESELCATCHNLYTQYVLEDGTFSEAWFPEQTPYSEWLHSDYATQSSCQDCHMPPAEGGVVLSTLGPQQVRSPFAKHSFVGGNAFMLGLLKNFGGEFGVQSGPEQLDPAIERTLNLLGTETAELEISAPELEGSSLGFDISTTIFTGHKFPTGYPSRRAWLHVIVKDGNGEVVFESGAVRDNGAIAGNANDELGDAYEPHYQLINSPDQVQVYETILADVGDQQTTVLLSAAYYLKDNRLLPVGFDKTTAEEDIQPTGGAYADGDFRAGGDTVRYQIDLGSRSGPYTVEAALLYQSISYRWAMDLREYDTEQAGIFSEYYDASPNLPVIVASQMVIAE